MKLTHYDTYTDALPELLYGVINDGHIVQSRVAPCYELTGVAYTIDRPDRLFTLVPGRNANPFALLAETLWVLAGRNDVSFLQHYLPRAEQFSDNGKTWRAGYGPRLRRWDWQNSPHAGSINAVGKLWASGAPVVSATGKIDQLAAVLAILQADSASRQAVISLWDPSNDLIDPQTGQLLQTRDKPCNDFLQFLVRDYKLDLHVVQRSNDVIWGSMINTFEWGLLQTVVARCLGVQVGCLKFFTGSLHLYQYHHERAEKILQLEESTNALRPLVAYGTAPLTFNGTGWYDNALASFDAQVQTLLERATFWKTVPPPVEVEPTLRGRGITDPFLLACGRMLHLYQLIKNQAPKDDIVQSLNKLPDEMNIVATEWYCRTQHVSSMDSMNASTHTKLFWQWWFIQFGSFTQAAEAQAAEAQAATPATPTTPTTATAEEAGSQPAVDIVSTLTLLHTKKSASYGDSWKKHGELLSIFANIARKVDRIEGLHAGGTATTDESLLDTVADLVVYLSKYLGWQLEQSAKLRETIHLGSFEEQVQSLDWWYKGKAPEELARLPEEATQASSYAGLLVGYGKLEAWILPKSGNRVNWPEGTYAYYPWNKWNLTKNVAMLAYSYLNELVIQSPEQWASYVQKVQQL